MNLSGSYTSDIARDVYGDLRDRFFSPDPSINTILAQIFTQQGKVVRPLFMSLIGDIVGGSWKRLRRAAVIVEAIHIASLIHDDIVDDSDLRRGKATLKREIFLKHIGAVRRSYFSLKRFIWPTLSIILAFTISSIMP